MGVEGGINAKNRKLVSVIFNDVEKRYKPSKHYVFILQIMWSDNTEYVIYRSYSAFYDFHISLIQTFPIEAGEINHTERTIPLLPSRRLFQRAEIKRIANVRKQELGVYCVQLLKMKDEISQCPQVHGFFSPTDEDISPPSGASTKPRRSSLLSALTPIIHKVKGRPDNSPNADDMSISGPMELEQYRAIATYKAESKREMSFYQAETLDIIEKHEHGWWFAQIEERQGWVPAAYLEPLLTSGEQDEPEMRLEGETYITIADYTAQFEDEISFVKGAIVDVMHKLLDGWWVVSYQGNVGFAPATYLKPYKNIHLRPSPRPSPELPTKFKKPSPRRRTIKNQSSKWTNRKLERDLTLYRKFSDKRLQAKIQKAVKNISFDRQHEEGLSVPPTNYVIDEGFPTTRAPIPRPDHQKPVPKARYQEPEDDDSDDYEQYEDDDNEDYDEIPDDQDNEDGIRPSYNQEQNTGRCSDTYEVFYDDVAESEGPVLPQKYRQYPRNSVDDEIAEVYTCEDVSEEATRSDSEYYDDVEDIVASSKPPIGIKPKPGVLAPKPAAPPKPKLTNNVNNKKPQQPPKPKPRTNLQQRKESSSDEKDQEKDPEKQNLRDKVAMFNAVLNKS